MFELRESKMGHYKISPGSIAQWSKRFTRSLSGYSPPEVKVPCGECTACCRKPGLVVNLWPGEEQKYPEAVWNNALTSWMLPKRDNGECIYLTEGRCSIYQNRPLACRMFDCRKYLVGMPIHAKKQLPLVQETMQRWDEWKLETTDDVDALFAWHGAVNETLHNGQEVSAKRFRELVLGNFLRLRPLTYEVRRSVGFRQAKALVREQDQLFRHKLLEIYERSFG